VRRARELHEAAAEQQMRFRRLLALADLHIETRDWTRARDYLDRALSNCGSLAMRGANVCARLGLVHFRTERYEEAVENFRRAVLVKPGDLTLRSNLGKALLRLKRFDAAQDEFARVLRNGPGNIDALLGAARVCIDLADEGDPDQYRLAERYLSDALKHGLERSGSKQLRGVELANVYYLRGYVRVKRYESDPKASQLIALVNARTDFRNCLRVDRNHPKAAAAMAKIMKHVGRRGAESLIDVLGPLAICLFSTLVFLLAQVDFMFRGTSLRAALGFLPANVITDPKIYAAVTFSALLFMVAGLYLPKVLKLKVAGIELQKTSAEQVSAPSTLDITRLASIKD
jgi:tetratricopeptide (TPR) repeat protein